MDIEGKVTFLCNCHQSPPVSHAVSELVIHTGGRLAGCPPHLPHHVQTRHTEAPWHSGLLDLELAFSLYPMYSTGFIFNVEFRAMIGWWLHAPLVRQQTTQSEGSLCACNNKGDIKKVLKFSGLFRCSKSVIKIVTGSLFHLGNF